MLVAFVSGWVGLNGLERVGIGEMVGEWGRDCVQDGCERNVWEWGVVLVIGNTFFDDGLRGYRHDLFRERERAGPSTDA